MQRIVEVSKENLEQEHICCAIGRDFQNRARADAKKAWMSCRFGKGHRFLKADLRGKVFIEFEPIEHALAPVEGEGYQLIQCLWAAGKYKGQGYGRALLEACERESAGSAGLAAISTDKKRPFVTDGKFLRAMGFEVVDRADPYFELLAKPVAGGAPAPRFADSARSATLPGSKGFDFFFTGGCPYNEEYAELLATSARSRGHRADLHPVTTRDHALSLPVAWPLYSFFYDGKFISQEIYTETKFASFLDSLESS